jgi:serine phosphatase RsbU (regulator of sigma subunit)
MNASLARRLAAFNTRPWVVTVAVALTSAVAVADALIDGDAVLIGWLGIGPFVTAVFLGPGSTVAVAAYSLSLGVVLGEPDNIWGTADHLTRVAGLAVACVAATVLSALRVQRDESLAQVSRVAAITQRAILRPVPARIGPMRFAARYHSAAAEAVIGGDFYDVALTPWGLRAIVGDVRGKGIDGIRLASFTLGAFRETVFAHARLAHVGAALDEKVSGELGDEDFVTAVLVTFGSDEIEVVNFGHLPPVVCGPERTRLLQPSTPSTPLGLAPDVVADRFPFESKERLLLYTDGLTEGRDNEGSFFDLDLRLPRCLDFDHVEEWADWLVAEALDHVGGRLGDDLALLVAEVTDGQLDDLDSWLRQVVEPVTAKTSG